MRRIQYECSACGTNDDVELTGKSIPYVQPCPTCGVNMVYLGGSTGCGASEQPISTYKVYRSGIFADGSLQESA